MLSYFYFKYMSSVIETSDCTSELNPRAVMNFIETEKTPDRTLRDDKNFFFFLKYW